MCKQYKELTDFHIDKNRPLGRTYRCKDCSVVYATEYNRTHRDKQILTNAKYREKLKLETYNRYSKGKIRCACCGEKTVEFLSIDHVNNNGKQERKLYGRGGGYSFYLKLRELKYPEGYQVLCHNCNQAKQHYGKCPHKTKSRYPSI